MGISFWQIIIVVLIAVLLFGRGKISELMGDVAKGIKSFRKGMAEDDQSEPKRINAETNVETSTTETKTDEKKVS